MLESFKIYVNFNNTKYLLMRIVCHLNFKTSTEGLQEGIEQKTYVTTQTLKYKNILLYFIFNKFRF